LARRTLPAITVQNAQTKTEQSLQAVVTVGPETAALLSEKLGRTVLPGEQFDIGTVAYYHPNPLRRLWGSLKASRRHLFSKPLNQ
jgi:hypothetical protein